MALWTGFTLGVTPAVAAACAPLWGRVGDRFGNKLLVQRSLFFCVFVMTLMGLATQPWQLFALRALQGLVAGYGPLTIAMAAESAPRERMAHAIGLVQTAQRVAPAVGPVVGGILAQAVGLRNAFFVAGAVYALAFALVSVLYRESARTSREDEARVHVPMREILSIRNLLLLMGVIFGLQLTERSLGPVLLLHVESLGYTSAAVLVGVLFSLLSIAGALGHQIAASALARAPARRVIATAIVVAAAGLAVFADDERRVGADGRHPRGGRRRGRGDDRGLHRRRRQHSAPRAQHQLRVPHRRVAHRHRRGARARRPRGGAQHHGGVRPRRRRSWPRSP